MSKITKLLRINTKKGPEAIGPYSTATVHKGVMYVSGQIGI
jgi:enamine deaminase RidA (YjgF/YER057c/UK114 family)